MSNLTFEDWKAEYYPVPARVAVGTWLEAAKHSLRKWKGVPKEVLEQYGLSRSGCSIGDDEFYLSANTCALCIKPQDKFGDLDCPACPLKAIRKCCCDDDSPYDRVTCGVYSENQEAAVHDMIADLGAVVACLERPEDFFEGNELNDFHARFCSD